jgi:hypothetical protein
LGVLERLSSEVAGWSSSNDCDLEFAHNIILSFGLVRSSFIIGA